MPRCGVPDMPDMGSIMKRKRRYVTANTEWEKTDLTYKIDNYSPDMSQPEIRAEMKRAFKVWSDNSGLTFTEVSSSNADIRISVSVGPL